MTPIGLIYGTNTGFTELVTKVIKEEFEHVAPNLVTVHDVAEVPLETMLAYDLLIIGCPTWNEGHLQDDWDNEFLALEELDLSGKKIAIFGLGDQFGYPEHYCDALGILGHRFIAQGAELVGFTSTAGYEFSHSRGVENGKFLGLALDEDNESDRTPDRVTDWVWQLVDEFDLVEYLEPVYA